MRCTSKLERGEGGVLSDGRCGETKLGPVLPLVPYHKPNVPYVSQLNGTGGYQNNAEISFFVSYRFVMTEYWESGEIDH